jgi:pimeloyl-ACP methyl ester carboxylesterase
MLAPQNAKGPAVLILPGSGPTDRDGNNPLGIKGSPYRLLAEGLAGKGIATVRIDKRGLAGSARAVRNANSTTMSGYAADVHAWIKVIQEKTGAPCVWLAGHSEGGLVALAASREPGDICGLVLIAAPGRPAGQVLRDQLEARLGNAPFFDQGVWAIGELEAGRHVRRDAIHPALMPLLRPDLQDYLISMFALDPAKLAAGFDKPVLVVQGDRDLQVSVADAKRLKQAAPNAKLLLLPDTNHVLKTVKSADRAANMVAYTKADVPLPPGLTSGIAEFIQSAPQG